MGRRPLADRDVAAHRRLGQPRRRALRPGAARSAGRCDVASSEPLSSASHPSMVGFHGPERRGGAVSLLTRRRDGRGQCLAHRPSVHPEAFRQARGSTARRARGTSGSARTSSTFDRFVMDPRVLAACCSQVDPSMASPPGGAKSDRHSGARSGDHTHGPVPGRRSGSGPRCSGPFSCLSPSFPGS